MFEYVSDLRFLQPVGIVKQIIIAAEEVMLLVAEALNGHQSAHHMRLRFELTVSKDVVNRGASAFKMPANQDGSMTVEGLLLGAHQGKSATAGTCLNALNPALKGCGSLNHFVADPAVYVAGGKIASCAEFFAEEDVFDT